MFYLTIAIIIAIVYFIQDYQFKKGSYYKVTHNSLLSTMFDLGRFGEYQIYHKLRNYESMGGKFLFNCYLPKDNGETTEIDVLLINSEGIYVFESKNYSGWIFGDEKAKNWTQTLSRGRGRAHKEHFFNPIMQNKVHIKWLRNIVDDDIPIYSIIVFSERCTLKNVNVQSQEIQVINRYDVNRAVVKAGEINRNRLSDDEINDLYNKLYPNTQVSNEQKLEHIENIKKNHGDIVEKNVISIEHAQDNQEIKKENDRKDQEITENGSLIKEPLIENNISEKAEEQLVCPKCGATMVLRTTKKGVNAGKQFYGCSNFPKCRYLKAE